MNDRPRDQEAGSAQPDAVRAQIARDLHAEIAKVQRRFHDCARIVGDGYRAMGKTNVRVNLNAKFHVRATNGVADVSQLAIVLPVDAPAPAASCYKEKFPLRFTSTIEFEGEYSYPMCVSVLPEPPEV